MSAETTPIYLDPTQPVNERVKDLLGCMTVAEKISHMRNAASPVERLGIPAYDYWNEALHGVARNGRATVFPQAIGMAATWDPDLVFRVADAISDEGRAKYHAALKRKGFTSIYQGLTFWSPNVNIFRDPRWGRGQETWGEDPFLTGEMGAAFVRGLQGSHPKYMKTAACAKHYAVHSGPEKDRHTFNAVVSKRDLHETYLAAFKKLVTEAKVEAVMGAYNRLYGEPCNASYLLLDEILRKSWGFEGHVVSDCGALTDIHRHHKVTKDGAESAALALKAGCDIGCDCVFYDHLQEALERGLVTEADIDQALARVLKTRFKLGMFDPDELVPFTAVSASVINSPEHRSLAHEAAAKSVVLLKNRNQILPIKDDVRSLAVVGPNAASADILLGNYYGISDTLTTLIEGIVSRAPEGMKVEYRPGCTLTQETVNPINWSINTAAASDLTIACMGISPQMEGEEGEAILAKDNGDRSDIGLPAAQVNYLKKLVINGAKVVLVLAGGSPITLGEIEDMVEAIVFIWYPGQEGGKALADVLFGHVSPSGKLPLTFPKSVEQLPPFDDYDMADRTYRYASWEPMFPFGFGLSYTTFEYSQLSLAQSSLAAGADLTFNVMVANRGTREAEEVLQVYLSDLEASVPVPQQRLVDFRRIRLEPGESRSYAFTLPADKMMLYNENGDLQLEPGQFRLVVGGCSPGSRAQALGAPAPVTATFSVGL
jgi:beta-glucosidase